MNIDIVRQLLRIKTLRADRAEDGYRRQLAIRAAAIAAAEEASRLLEEWRADLPRKEAAVYDTVIGHVVDLQALDDMKARIVALREHTQLLETRLGEAREKVRAADKALQDAAAVLAQARRDVSKFEEIVTMLRHAHLMEAERREDLEMEEFARPRDDADTLEQEGDDNGWHSAA